ncbi:MAG: metal dependent phosphohydrolase [Acidobacteria bacterium]|nr:metal dependent phosphohydrolase [Acidobacteriota bacterium]
MGLLARLRSSLTYPIAATLVLVTVVPVTLVGWLLASYNREHLTFVEKRFLSLEARGLAGEVSEFLESHRIQLQSTVLGLEAGGAIEVSGFEQLLQDIAGEQDRAFVYLQILDERGEGTFVRSPSLSDEVGPTLTEAVAEAHATAIAGEPVERILTDLPSGEVTKAIYAFPLRSADGDVWGSLTGVLDLEALALRFDENARAGFIVSLFDANGLVLVSSHPRLRGRDLSQSPLVRDLLRRPVHLTSTYTHPVPSVALDVLGAVSPVAGAGWGLLIERPTKEAYAPVRVAQQRTLVVSAFAALVALALGFVLSRRLIVPLQSLTGVSSAIAEGNFAVRADVKGTDELARLASNFNHMSGSIEALVRRLKQALRQNQELFLETIRTLAAAIDAKDPYTRGHSERVSSYSMAIARHLGLTQDEVFRVRTAAILHDVGKLGIRDGILNKPGGLTDEEYAVMRQHTAIGAQIMEPIRMLKDIIPGIRNHHEAWDGTGYPDRLAGDQVPLVARIIGVADTFDAMTTNRPYQEAKTLDFVLARMRAMSGNKFDPKVVDALLAAVAAGDVTPPSATQGPAARQEVS